MIKDPESGESSLEYINNQEPTVSSGFGLIDPNDGGLLDADNSDGALSVDEGEADMVIVDDVLYASDIVPESIIKNASFVLSSNASGSENIFNEDIRYSKKISNTKNIVVNKKFSSFFDYKILIDNFKKNAQVGAKLYLSDNKFHDKIVRYANENDVSYNSEEELGFLENNNGGKSSISFDGKYNFICDVASSYQDKVIGLQDSSGLEANEGMIFPYKEIAPQYFHMGTVSFPIDIVFAREGEVVRVFEGIQPGDLGVYGAESDLVIELRSGTCSDRDIREGSIVSVDSLESEFKSDLPSRDMYSLADLIDLDKAILKVAGISKIFDCNDLKKGVPNLISGHKMYFAEKRADFLPLNNNFILYHETNLGNVEVRRLFDSAYPKYSYDVVKMKKTEPVTMAKFAMDQFGCAECMIFDFQIKKDASFPVPENTRLIVRKVDSVIIKVTKALSLLIKDINKNVSIYRKQKDNATAILESKGAYRQSMRRLSKKFKSILSLVKIIISGLAEIRDANAIDEIISSITVTSQNASKFFKEIMEMQEKVDDLKFFQNLSTSTEDFIKISEDLETVLKRAREFIFVNVLGKSLLTE